MSTSCRKLVAACATFLFLGIWAWAFTPLMKSAFAEEPAMQSEAPQGLRISPQVALALPQPLAIGAETFRAHDTALRGFGSIGYVPVPLPGSGKSLSIFSIQAGARYFPWKRGFFGAFCLGYRHIAFSADTSAFKLDDVVVATNGTIDLHTVFLGSSLGAEFSLSQSLTFGFDLGLQLALMGSGRMNLVDSQTGTDSSNSDILAINDPSSMERVAKLLLPQITLFRLTWHLD